MKDSAFKIRWSLPYESPQPDAPNRRRRATAARIAVYILLAAAFITPVVQFQVKTSRNLRKAARFDRKYPNWSPAQQAAGGLRRPKEHKGAIGRWRKAIHNFWAGENIYLRPDQTKAEPPAPPDSQPTRRYGRTHLHPNMPFTVILLSPLAYLPVWAMAISWNVLKLVVLAATCLMAARLAGHKQRRPHDWVLALAIAWSILMIVDDMLHGNTNVFVLGALALHLWLYRRGRDYLAGLPLALAICLKMTPAIFVLYWLYQRNWKLLVGVLAALMLLAVVVPVAAVGPTRYATLTETWLDNLVVPGLVKGAWYPIHVNQSISGVLSRYCFGEPSPNGNIFWGPDDNPYDVQDTFGWIAMVSLSPARVKMLVRASQLLVVGLLAWAIGWRKLPRDDGRRALHYGLVVIAMLLLNQRTWEHHAVVLLIADIAIWQAIAFGRFSRRVRGWALGLMLAAGAALFFSRSDIIKLIGSLFGKAGQDAEILADTVKAYGPTFYHFLLLLATAVLLAVAMKKSDCPYAEARQKLSG